MVKIPHASNLIGREEFIMKINNVLRFDLSQYSHGTLHISAVKSAACSHTDRD